MLGRQLLERGNRLDGMTEQAWRQLVSALNSAGDTARQAKRQTSRLADQAGDRADEAWSRATAAYGALAGRRPGRPWPWIIGAAAIGVALGWLAGQAARAAISPAPDDERASGRIEYLDADRVN